MLARAICQEPEIIILDEPTAMLDPNGRSEVIRTVRELNQLEGITVILVTHSTEIAGYAKRTICMSDGQIVAGLFGKEAAK